MSLLADQNETLIKNQVFSVEPGYVILQHSGQGNGLLEGKLDFKCLWRNFSNPTFLQEVILLPFILTTDEFEACIIKHTGGCYCKNIAYSTEYDPMLVFNCHCLTCKEISGEGMSTAVTFSESEVEFSMDMKIFEYKGGSGESMYKYFCENCGCRLITKVDLIEGFIYLSLIHI